MSKTTGTETFFFSIYSEVADYFNKSNLNAVICSKA